MMICSLILSGVSGCYLVLWLLSVVVRPLSLSVSEVYTSGCPGNVRFSYWMRVSAAVSTFMVLNTNIKVLHAKCFVAVLLVTLLFL